MTIKPCPFCGSKNLDIELLSDNRSRVRCCCCKLHGPIASNKKDSIVFWNKALRPEGESK
jgi:Lar family restriction alleviation protein